jgi:MSHA pilin protein MshC
MSEGHSKTKLGGKARKQQGFTFVELITVMLLVGILSAVAFSRFANPDIYNEALFVNKLQSYLRLTQQIALSHSSPDSTDISQLMIELKDDSHWKISILNGEQSRVHKLSMNSPISLGDQIINSTLLLSFSSKGDLVELQLGSITQAVSKSIALHVGNTPICIAPTGYSYEGACI